MLAAVVSLRDIADVEGFVCATLERFQRESEVELADDEYEELTLEGITIVYELAAKFEPHRAGYAQAGRFSGYAACFLPKRLGDAWHRRHPEHRYVTGDDGKRHWEYLKQTVSLEEELAARPGGDGCGLRGFSEERNVLEPSKWVPVPALPSAA